MITWDDVNKGSGVVLSNDNMTASIPSYLHAVRASEGKIGGKWYWEIKFTIIGYGGAMVGIVNENVSLNASSYPSPYARYYYTTNGYKYPDAKPYGDAYTQNDIIGVLLDLDKGTLSFLKNGVSQGISHTDIKSLGMVYPAISSGSSTAGNSCTVNFGATPFAYPIPAGYAAYDRPKNKSLIFHNNEYKTVTPEIPYSPPVLGAKVAVVPNMTSNTAPSGLVFASSFEGGREPWRAFNNNNAGLTYTFKTPNYKADGEFIGYIFTEAQKISSYAIYPVNIGPLYGWDFQISNDTTDGSNGTWTTVDTKRNQNMTQSLMHYDLSNEVAAKAFRIVTRPAIGAGNLISSWLRQIQIYKKEILYPEIPAQPMKIVTVSTATPTVDQFMEHGMEQLSPLLDRVTKESDPIPMIQIDL